MSLFQKYKLWVTPQPENDKTWSPPTSFSVDSEGRKTLLWVNIQLVQRKRVTTGRNCSLDIHSLWPDLRNSLGCSCSVWFFSTVIREWLGIFCRKKSLGALNRKGWVQLQTWELTINWPFEQLQAQNETIHGMFPCRMEPAHLGMGLRTAEMFAVLVLPSGLMAKILSD